MPFESTVEAEGQSLSMDFRAFFLEAPEFQKFRNAPTGLRFNAVTSACEKTFSEFAASKFLV